MILMQQSRHAELMEASLTLEEKETYGGYFECFHQHIKKLFENPSIVSESYQKLRAHDDEQLSQYYVCLGTAG